MSLRAVGALTRASWLQARSYRLSLVLQASGLVFTVLPIWFIARALQPTMEVRIAGEAHQYFAFVLLGSIAVLYSSTALTTLQGSVGGGIASGYFETLLMTRAGAPAVLAGLTGFALVLTTLRAGAMLLAGWVLGAEVAWSRLPAALLVLALIVVAHWGIGLFGAALVVAFRTTGAITRTVSALSILFGGVYYPTSSIPSWLGVVSEFMPLAYGLRPLRRILLQGASLATVSGDVAVLAGAGLVLLAGGGLAMRAALSYARRSGSLGVY